MKIITLVENRTTSKEYKCKHGLSLYIETSNQKILFDMGPNNYYLQNAKKLDVKIEDVDLAVISHGHFDHGGGLGSFLKVNDKAKVYLSKKAFCKHYKKLRFFNRIA